MAAMSVLIEHGSHISSGGVGGLSIGIADSLHISVGITNLCIKVLIFVFILCFDGKVTALWTVIGAVLTGTYMLLFEHIPLDLDWPKWLSFCVILLFAKLPIGLLVSRGYSTGGFTAIAQLLWRRFHLPLWASLFVLNLSAIATMSLAHGLASGALTCVIAMSAGFMVQAWAAVISKFLDGGKSEA